MKKAFLYTLFAAFSVAAVAQNAPARGINNSLQATVLSGFKMPGQTEELFFMDGKLHVSTGEMLFAVAVYDGRLGFPEIDTALTTIDPQLMYAVRHPLTGTLYFTKKDSKGVVCLYEYYEKKPGKYGVRRIKPYGFSFSVEHPVFSSDGRAMVFASDCPIGFGGRDLWYSELKNGEWQYPQNMGHRINSEGDESMPSIYGDFLMFVSDGRADGLGGRDLYATRLVALEQTGDTVMMYPVGRSEVQSLEAPFCSADDDFGFTVDGAGGGWWLSRDTSGNELFHSFAGRMDCIRLTGVVSDIDGNTLADATVTVRSNGRQEFALCCDAEGRYVLFLQPDREYELTFAAPEHFVFKQNMSLSRCKENRLYADEKYNVTLLAFSLNTAYSYSDLFNSSVSSELSASGRKRMDLIVQFLAENPHLKLSIASTYSQSADIPFCNLLNNSRLRALTNYAVSKGVPQSAIVTSTAKPTVRVVQEGEDDARLSAAAQSSLTVYFTFLR